MAPDVAGLKREAREEIARFEEAARRAGIAKEVIVAARYALCASIDEAVLSTVWGGQSEWAQKTLLVMLHGEASGGEKFFQVLDGLTRKAAVHIDLMELYYLCLATGFSGKFEAVEGGRSKLFDIQRDVYRKIRAHRGAAEQELSLRWQGLEDRRNPLIRYIPWWMVGAAVLVLLSGLFIYFYFALGSVSSPVHAQLARVGLEDFDRPRPALPGPTLKQLLAPEEGRGSVSVEEDGGITTITLLAPNLFASASANLNAEHQETLHRITEALNLVPGRVLVEGHTDDQPIRSLRFSDNFQLSRERAVGVATILQANIDVPARVEVSGAGSSKPRYLPVELNRARNRREGERNLVGN